MDTKALRQKILDLAIRGKLVPQDPNDEPASVLLERIRAEKQQMVKDGKLKAKDIKNDTVIFKGDDNLHYEQFADGTVKCIEDEIPFDLPEGWEWCRLQTLCVKEIKRGKAPKYEEKSNTLVFAQKCNTKAGYIDISKAKFLDQSTLKKYTDEDYLSYNDIIINSTGTGTLGRIGIYMESDDAYGIKIVPDSHITIVRTMSSEMNSRYVYYFLKYHQSYFENSGVGSTNQKELKPEVISTFLVAVPPIEEQNNIVSKIDIANNYSFDLDNKKEQLKELISAIKSKILDLAIRGKLVPQNPNDEPASVLLERIRAEKEELIKQGKIKRDKKESVIFKGDDNSYYEKIGDEITCIDDEIPFEIPNTWEWLRLENCCSKEIRRGKSPKYTDASGTLVFAQKCNTKYAGIDIGLALYLDENTLSKYPADEYMQDGDVVINSTGTGTLGRVGLYQIADNRSCLPIVPDSHVTVIRSFKNIQSFYLYTFLKANQSKLEKKGEGSTNQKELKPVTLKELLVPMPPLTEQKQISATIMRIFSIINTIEKSLS